jgi:Protein of unknown function (DUF1552)
MKNRLPRRMFLRGSLCGVASTLALPIFDAALNAHGTAFADEKPLPKTFGTWFWGDGLCAAEWWPQAEGANYKPSISLQPLADAGVLDSVTTVRNTGYLYDPGLDHHAGWVIYLSGSPHTTNAGRYQDGDFIDPSVDQVVAQEWKGLTRLNSVAIAVSEQGAIEGDRKYCTAISQKGKNQPIYGISSPKKLFEQFFGPGGTVTGTVDETWKQKKSILNAYVGQARELKKKLGKTDAERMDQYLTSVTEIERRVQAPPAVPNNAGDYTDNLDPLEKEDLVGRGRLLYDLLIEGLKVDATRVYSVCFTPMQAETTYWMLQLEGKEKQGHKIAHGNPIGDMGKIVKFTMGELGYLLKKMRSTTLGAQNLLYQTCLYGTSEYGNGHSFEDMPCLIAGRAGGALKPGQYLSVRGASIMRVHFSMFKAVGLGIKQFGVIGTNQKGEKRDGVTSEPIAALLA